MKDTICIVTGANSGIGKITARSLAQQGAHVVMACRNLERGEEALADIRAEVEGASLELMHIDLASLASVRTFVSGFAANHSRLDVLVNNAGAYIPKRYETEDGFELTMGANHFAPFLLTELLTDALAEAKSGRIVNVSSMGHKMGRLRLDDLPQVNKFRGLKAYCDSKLANIYHANMLAKRLESRGITANSLHPGVIATGFAQDEGSAFGLLVKIGGPFLSSPEKGARTSIYLASSPDVEGVTGTYFARCRPAKPSRLARDMSIAEALWDLSEKVVGLSQ